MAEESHNRLFYPLRCEHEGCNVKVGDVECRTVMVMTASTFMMHILWLSISQCESLSRKV